MSHGIVSREYWIIDNPVIIPFISPNIIVVNYDSKYSINNKSLKIV